jgi:hypothetical protein
VLALFLRFLVVAGAFLLLTHYALTMTTQPIYHGHLQLLVTVRRGHGVGGLSVGILPSLACLFAGSNNAGTGDAFYIQDDRINYFQVAVGAVRSSSALFRDSSGWYHILGVSDSSNPTAQNRFRIYVNGVEITNYAVTTYPSLNADLEINNNIAHNIGNRPLGSFYFDGYLAESQLHRRSSPNR